MKKNAANPLKDRGSFDSKAQARLLLHFYKIEPEKYKWVIDLLRESGFPETEKIPDSKCYWAPEYKISPDTPSYQYTGNKYKKTKSDLTEGLIKLAYRLKDEEQLLKQLLDIFE